jgi:hypothetical protein
MEEKHMQHADPRDTWIEWVTEVVEPDEDVRLAVLRDLIFDTAKDGVAIGEITAEWANKKLAKLGVVKRLDSLNRYKIATTVTADVELEVYGADRAAALDAFNAKVNDRITVAAADAPFALKFVSGPEDPTGQVDPDAPTTVDATLVKLREYIMLGVIAGPRYCEKGANRILAAYGLDPVPAMKKFTVGMPVEAAMKTTVEAYDEASARRIAGWRWDDGRTGFDLDHVMDTGALTVTPVN